MAEDLCRKSAIIETYVMDSRIGQCLLPSPHPSSSLSPPASFHCPVLQILSSLLAKLLPRPQLAEGRAGQTHTLVSLSLFCLLSWLLPPLRVSAFSPLSFLWRISPSSFSFLLPVSLPLLFSLPPLSGPSPLCLVSLFLSMLFHLEIFLHCMCIPLGSLSLPHLSPSSLLSLPSPLLSSFLPPPRLCFFCSFLSNLFISPFPYESE